eukprot:6172109-Pleurochrysis_carterae.AAC.3
MKGNADKNRKTEDSQAQNDSLPEEAAPADAHAINFDLLAATLRPSTTADPEKLKKQSLAPVIIEQNYATQTSPDASRAVAPSVEQRASKLAVSRI